MASLDTSITIRAGVEGLADLKRLTDIIEQAGGDVTQLRDATQRLGDSWNNLSTEEQNRQLQDLGRSAQDLARDTNRATEQMERFLGVRTNNTINQEIEQVNNALTELQRRYNAGTISQEEFNRMSQAGEQRLNALQGELGQTSNSMERLFNVRPNNVIEQEIHQVSNALRDLESRQRAGTISQEEFNRLTRAGEQRLNALRNELNGTTASLNQTDAASRRAGGGANDLGAAFGRLQNVLGVLGVSFGAMEIIQLADQFKSLEATVRLATGEGANFVTGFQGVKDIANETFTSIEDTGELFARITRAGEAMNLAQKDTLQVTKTINEAIKLSGGTAESNQAAITQLIQGLQSGVLRGEEFNSVMEQAPRLARAMADGLGVTTGQLRAMAAEGELTSEVVIKALQSQSAAIQAEFDQMPMTVANATQRVKNNFMQLVGDLDAQLNSSGGLASLIDGVAQSLEDIDPTIVDALKQSFEAVGSATLSAFDSVKVLYDGVTDTINAIGGFDDSVEKVGLLTRALQGTSVLVGVLADGFSGLKIIFEAFAAAAYESLSWIAEGLAKITFGDVSKSFEDMAERMKVKMHEADQAMHDDMMNFKSSAVEAFTDAAKTQQERLNETAQKATENYQKMAEDADVSADKQQAAAIEAAQAIVKANNGVLDAKAEAILAEQNLQGKIDETGKLQIEQNAQVKKGLIELVMEAQQAGTDVQAAIRKSVAGAQTRAELEQIGKDIAALGEAGKLSGAQMAAATNQVAQRHQELDAELQKNIDAFADVARAAVDSGDAQKIAEMEKQAAARGLTVIYDEQKNVMITAAQTASDTASEIKKEYASLAGSLELDFDAAMTGVADSFAQAGEGIRKIASDADRFKEAGIDASQLVTQGLLNMQKQANNTAEFEQLTALIKDMGQKGLIAGDEFAAGLEEAQKKAKTVEDYENLIALWEAAGETGAISGEKMARGIEFARSKIDELTDGVNSATEAYKLMGIQSQKELQERAAAFKQAYDLINADVTASQKIKQEAYQKYAQAAVDANDGVMNAEIKAQAAARGFADVSVERGRVVTKTHDEVAQSLNRVSNQARGAGNAISSAGASGKSSFDSMNNTLDNTISKLETIEARNRAIQQQTAKESAARDANNMALATKSTQDVANYSTATAIEGFLKSAGVSAERAFKETQALMSQYGRDGRMNWAAANGVAEGRPMSAAEFAKYKSPSVYLLDVAEKAKAQEQQQKEYEAHKKRLEEWNAKEQERMAQATKMTQSGTQINATDVANSFASLIEQAKKDGAQELARQLMEEAKRLAR